MRRDAATVGSPYPRPALMADRRFLPIIPLRSSVLFPGPTVNITLRATERSSLPCAWGLPEDVLRGVLGSVHDAGELSDFVATYFELPVPEKQALLETLGV